MGRIENTPLDDQPPKKTRSLPWAMLVCVALFLLVAFLFFPRAHTYSRIELISKESPLFSTFYGSAQRRSSKQGNPVVRFDIILPIASNFVVDRARLDRATIQSQSTGEIKDVTLSAIVSPNEEFVGNDRLLRSNLNRAVSATRDKEETYKVELEYLLETGALEDGVYVIEILSEICDGDDCTPLPMRFQMRAYTKTSRDGLITSFIGAGV